MDSIAENSMTNNNENVATGVSGVEVPVHEVDATITESIIADASSSASSSASSECVELKHIQYKTMIQSGANGVVRRVIDNTKNLDTLEKFLQTSTETNKTGRWNKLDLTMKLQKISGFIETYTAENNHTPEEADALYKYLKECLDKKKLMRVKDVEYDNEKDMLVSIPGLQYVRSSGKYTIKNTDTKKKTVLSRLPPKKTTKKNSKCKDQTASQGPDC